MEHLEYLKQKSILENPLERWEQFDWNIDAEIKAFCSRLGICHETFPISDLKQIILSRDLEREGATEIEKLIEEVLNIILEAPEHVIMEIKESLLENENIAKIAKSIGFIDLMQRKNPSSEEIATQFRIGFFYFFLFFSRFFILLTSEGSLKPNPFKFIDRSYGRN